MLKDLQELRDQYVDQADKVLVVMEDLNKTIKHLKEVNPIYGAIKKLEIMLDELFETNKSRLEIVEMIDKKIENLKGIEQ